MFNTIPIIFLIIFGFIIFYIRNLVNKSNNNFLKEHEYIIKFTVLIILLIIYL